MYLRIWARDWAKDIECELMEKILRIKKKKTNMTISDNRT